MESTSRISEEHIDTFVSLYTHQPQTLREIYKKIDALQRENFDLKLRLYHRNEIERKRYLESSKHQLFETTYKLETEKSALDKCKRERKNLEETSRQKIEELQQQLVNCKNKLECREQELNSVKKELRAVALEFAEKENDLATESQSSLVTLNRQNTSGLSTIEEETNSDFENNLNDGSRSDPMPDNDLSWQDLIQQLRVSSLLAKQLKVRQQGSILRLTQLIEQQRDPTAKPLQAVQHQTFSCSAIAFESMPCLQLLKSIPDWTATSTHDKCCTSLQRVLCDFDSSLASTLTEYAKEMDWPTLLNFDGQLKQRQLKRMRKFLHILAEKFETIESNYKVHLIRSKI